MLGTQVATIPSPGLPQLSVEKPNGQPSDSNSERPLLRASKRLLVVGLLAVAVVLLYKHVPGSTITPAVLPAKQSRLLRRTIIKNDPQKLHSWGHASSEAKEEKPSDFERHMLTGRRYLKKGKYADALSEFTKAKDDALKSKGKVTESIIKAQQWRAQAFSLQGKLGAADQALEVARSLGQHHGLESISLLHQFSVLRRDMGQLRSALSFVQKAQLKNKNLELYPALLLAEAEVEQHRGNHTKAKEFGQEALRQHNKIFEGSSRSTSELDVEAGAIYGLLGRVEYSIGDVKSAMQMLRLSTNLLSNLYQGHPDFVETQIAMALCKRDLADMEGGLQILVDAEKTLRASSHEGPELGYILEHKAFFLNEMGRKNATKTIIEAIADLTQKYGGPKHWRIALAYNTYGNILHHNGLLKDAFGAYEKALQLNLDVVGFTHRRTAGSYNNLGLVYEELGDLAQAEEAFSKSLEINLHILGHQGPNVGIMHNNIAMLKMRQGKNSQAVEMLEEGLAMLRESGIPEQSSHFTSLSKNLATARKLMSKQALDKRQSAAVPSETRDQKAIDEQQGAAALTV